MYNSKIKHGVTGKNPFRVDGRLSACYGVIVIKMISRGGRIDKFYSRVFNSYPVISLLSSPTRSS